MFGIVFFFEGATFSDPVVFVLFRRLPLVTEQQSQKLFEKFYQWFFFSRRKLPDCLWFYLFVLAINFISVWRKQAMKKFVLQTGGFPVVRLNISGMITIFNPVFNSEAGAGKDLLIVIKLLFETWTLLFKMFCALNDRLVLCELITPS